jgi:hypothetical protein
VPLCVDGLTLPCASGTLAAAIATVSRESLMRRLFLHRSLAATVISLIALFFAMGGAPDPTPLVCDRANSTRP